MTFADAGLIAALTTWAVGSALVLTKIVVIVAVLRRSAIITSNKCLIALIIACLGIGALAVVALIHRLHSVACYWLASGLLGGSSS
jgi:fatty-acid desaturase